MLTLVIYLSVYHHLMAVLRQSLQQAAVSTRWVCQTKKIVEHGLGQGREPTEGAVPLVDLLVVKRAEVEVRGYHWGMDHEEEMQKQKKTLMVDSRLQLQMAIVGALTSVSEVVTWVLMIVGERILEEGPQVILRILQQNDLLGETEMLTRIPSVSPSVRYAWIESRWGLFGIGRISYSRKRCSLAGQTQRTWRTGVSGRCRFYDTNVALFVDPAVDL